MGAFSAVENSSKTGNVIPSSQLDALTVNFNSIIQLTAEQFDQLCQDNENLRFKRTATGGLIIMPSAEEETGNHNARLTA